MGMTHAAELASGRRFDFGNNWARFLGVLSEDRILAAEDSLLKLLGLKSLTEKTFLDVGCGSGLFSLAARRLGAGVHSFDYDPQSVACAAKLKERYFCGDPCWVIQEGSALDTAYMGSLGSFDIVYSWGVLHHTGNMYQALHNVSAAVKGQGKLAIAIYNDMGGGSIRWRWIKRQYCQLPAYLKPPFACAVLLPVELYSLAAYTARGEIRTYFHDIARYQAGRGMSWWHDRVDWIGGYPYEFAKPEEIFHFCRIRGFQLDNLITQRGGNGCNQFVFNQTGSPPV
jgi:2-polyprenyl-6-hydroxyphenyl methylase/3-demethylubiquinone-9 3-methyltransferase